MAQETRSTVSVLQLLLNILATLGVAIIGLLGVQLSNRVQEVQIRLDTELKNAQLELDRRRFEAEQQVRHDEIIIRYIPSVIGDSEKERREALAVLYVLFPNEAGGILQSAVDALDQETASEQIP